MNINTINGLSLSEKNYLQIQIDGIYLKLKKINKEKNKKNIYSFFWVIIFSLIVGSFLYFVERIPGEEILVTKIFEYSILPFVLGIVGLFSILLLINATLKGNIIKGMFDKIFSNLLEKEYIGYLIKSKGIKDYVNKLKKLDLIKNLKYLKFNGDDSLFGSNNIILEFPFDQYKISFLNLHGSSGTDNYEFSSYNIFFIELFNNQGNNVLNNIEKALIKHGLVKHKLFLDNNLIYIVFKNDTIFSLFKQILNKDDIIFKYYIDNYLKIKKVHNMFKEVI